MALGRFFNRPKDDDRKPDGAPTGGEPLLDSVHASAIGRGSFAEAKVKCERIAEREGPILLAELAEAAKSRSNKLIVDLSDVYMISSAGIGSLVQLHRACAQGGKLVLFGLNDELLAMLKVARLDRLFTILPTRDKAVEGLA